MGKKTYHFPLNLLTERKYSMNYKNYKAKKAYQGSDIPVKIIKENINIITDFVYNNFNNSLFSSYFPSHLKNADITHVFLKRDRKNVENYRPVSILPVLSKSIIGVCMIKCMYT